MKLRRNRIVINLNKARSDQQGCTRVRLWKGALECRVEAVENE